MDRKAILERIGEIIADLNEQYQHLAEHDRSDRLESELFAANAKFLSNHIQILQKLSEDEGQLPEAASALEIAEPLVQVKAVPEESMHTEQSVHPEIEVLSEPAAHLPLADQVLAEVPPSRNDLMANRTEQNLAAKFSQEPLQDLKRSISLNEKLVFVKDLFSGYSLAYQEALDQLERLNDFESASNYLNSHYVEQYKWAEKSATAEKFYALLRRRFTK